MPELPEVETMVRGVRPFAEGRRIAAVELCPCECRPITLEPSFADFAEQVAGTTVTAVRRIAKRAVFDLSSGRSIVIEPRMTGLLLLADAPDEGHLRICWRFAGRREFNAVWFWDRRGLGTVRLVSADDLEQRLGPQNLGRDALAMTIEDWRAACGSTKRAIKVALLDQRLVAGIGNLYASEILHVAGIHPETPADRLSAPRIARLHAATQSILAEAIACEGSTLGDATYRTALSVNGTYQDRHRVYKKDGAPCVRCGSAIQRTVQAQRSTFFCPKCQRKPATKDSG